MDALLSELSSILTAYGQEHLLRFWERLSGPERESLAGEVRSIDFELLKALRGSAEKAASAVGDIQPLDFIELPGDEISAAKWAGARKTGEKALADGSVAALVVAGGQGTRLGFDGPKGCFPIGPVSGRTLFQLFCEKVLAASRRYETTIPFLVMTSPSNDAATRAFLEENVWFGLPRDSVRIFSQGRMPAVDCDGKLILEGPGRIFMSPNGHGGSLKALWDCGVIEWLESRGIDTISYFQVDNPLVNAVDAAFIGFHIQEAAEMSLKVLRRTIPDEKLGVYCLGDGRRRVVEYIDMPAEKMNARDDEGRLLFAGGSIAIHCFSVDFVQRLNEGAFSLPIHCAAKKVPCVDESGAAVEPDEPNATKYETFVFDALLFTERVAAIETAREREFSPVKNASGADSPETARRDVSRHYASWLEAAGVEVPRDEEGGLLHAIEISPLVADSAEELKAVYDGPVKVDGPVVLE